MAGFEPKPAHPDLMEILVSRTQCVSVHNILHIFGLCDFRIDNATKTLLYCYFLYDFDHTKSIYLIFEQCIYKLWEEFKEKVVRMD